eukprot:Skav204106  [mRNA]  locus=scaffold1472:280426:283131:+ [translate_table: standard]
MASRTPDISATLAGFDIQGARGCSLVADRCNVLVEIHGTRLTETSVVLLASQFAVEGYGQDAFWSDHIHIPRDSELQQQTVQWAVNKPLPTMSQKIWLRNVISHDLQGINFVYDDQSFSMPMISNSTPRTINWLELFAGGFGGWKSAAEFVTSYFSTGTIRTIAVEHDAHIAMAYAITNHAGFVQQDEPLEPNFFEENTGDWVIRDDVMSMKWKHAAAAVGIDAVSISAPCPAWSGASSAPGLSRSDGLLLLESLLETRYFRPLLIHVEQVANFAMHSHRSIITRALHWMGYKVIFQRTLNVIDTLKSDRPRFFMVAIRVHGDMQLESIPVWSLDSLTIPTADVTFRCWTPEANTPLVLSDQALEIASDPRLTRARVPSGKTVLDTRIFQSDSVVPTFMSMYGQQHDLDFDYLLINKFYGHYLRDDSFPHQCRHWHASEITLKHGTTNQVFQFDDHIQAWVIQGNIVTPIQVIPLIAATCNLFWDAELNIQDVIGKYLNTRWGADQVGFQRMTDGFLMTLLSDPVSPEQMERYDELVKQIRDHPFADFIWHPDAPDIPSSNPHQVWASQVSFPDTQPDDEDGATQPFRIVLQGVVRFESGSQKFWFEGSIPYHKLSEIWGCVYSPFSLDTHAPGDPSVELVYDIDRLSTEDPEDDNGWLMMLVDDALTIMTIPKSLNVLDHPALCDWDHVYDQFGEVQRYQKTNMCLLVMPDPLPPPRSDSLSVMVVAAEAMCQQTWTWNPMTDTLLLGIRGDNIPRQTMADFWASVLTPEMLRVLGRTLEIRSSEAQLVLLFKPSREHGVCPNRQLRMALTGAAMKILADDATRSPDGESAPLRIRWLGAQIWTGQVPCSMTVGVMLRIIDIALQPIRGKDDYRLIMRGKLLINERKFELLKDEPSGMMA